MRIGNTVILTRSAGESFHYPYLPYASHDLLNPKETDKQGTILHSQSNKPS